MSITMQVTWDAHNQVYNSPCICGRTDVRKMPRSGKRRYRHKCPHGEWCVAGHPLLGTHANHPQCKKCLAETRKE